MFRPEKNKLMRIEAFISGGEKFSAGRKNDSMNVTSKSRTIASLMLAAAITIPLAIPSLSHAQSIGEQLFDTQGVNPEEQLLLESDELVYDDATQTVSAVGNVQIAYGDYTLVAQRVTYDRGTGRVIAFGDVEIVEPNGNRIFAEEIDITDDFQDGFVAALRVETPERTRFAAEGAERRDGEIAVFHNGVYTACEECKEYPSKPPLWQIRADRVIINQRTKRVHYEGASFELLGKPVIRLSKFSHADPSIKRSTGFLFPEIENNEHLGYSVKNSFFWAIAPNYDLTLSGTYYNRQGFLGEAEWRHRTELGEYNLKVAGISQNGQDEFVTGTTDNIEDERYAIMSKGAFTINPRWKFGWNALYQSDSNFASTYNQEGFESTNLTNDVYLTGLNDKNYFDLRAQQFLIQSNSANNVREDQQSDVLPSFDYNIVSDSDIAGGQVSLDVNVASLHRDIADITNDDGVVDVADNEKHYGIAGTSTRASAEIEWKSSALINGAKVTASLSGRVDGVWQDTENLNSATNPLTSNESILRTMPAAMLEIRYPLVASDGLVSQIFEPIAQVVVRPDEEDIGKFANEDAQSLVFDTTNLFEKDKFSGFDRAEGGTRANVGFRYSAAFADGGSINVAAGQSFHIAGKNSFAQGGLTNTGLESGLETDRSDYVASVNLDNGSGFSLGAQGRFDESNADLKRAEVSASYIDTVLAAKASYIFIDEQPNYGSATQREEITGSASVKLADYWRAFGSASYDLQNNSMFSRRVGVSYDDSCFSFSVAYSETEDRYTNDTTDQSINFSIGLRTIGATEFKRSLD